MLIPAYCVVAVRPKGWECEMPLSALERMLRCVDEEGLTSAGRLARVLEGGESRRRLLRPILCSGERFARR